MAGAAPDSRPSRPADREGGEPAPPPNRPRIARRPPNTGPLLPTVTDDERDVGWSEASEPDDDDRLRREVPPHHGS